MNKIFLSSLALYALTGCNRPNPDFIALENVITQPGIDILGTGQADNVFIRIPMTDEIIAIASHGKKTVFWSDLQSGSIMNHIQPNTCLVDAKTDYVGDCPYRLYCGGKVQLIIATSVNTPYATEICK